MVLMRQKCLLSDNNIFCRLGYRLSNNIYLKWMVFNSNVNLFVVFGQVVQQGRTDYQRNIG